MPISQTHAHDSTRPAASPACFEAWQALVAPGDVFGHPREVLAHLGLTPAEKRAILASWASDTHAVADAPALRCLAGGRAEPVPVEAVLAALRALDGDGRSDAGAPPRGHRPARRRRDLFAGLRRAVGRRRRDDDDEPPPCPATIMPRPPAPLAPAAIAVPFAAQAA